MEKCTANRHVAVVENCLMTKLGLRQLFSCCSGTPYQLDAFKDSGDWFARRAHRRPYDIVIYSVAVTRQSRQHSIYFLTHLARKQPDAVRVLLADDEVQGKLIHHLLPVPLHAVLCKSSSVEKLRLQLNALMLQKESLCRPYKTLSCRSGSGGLSPTERTILDYMGKGLSIPEIAIRMARNAKTIRTHKFNAMNKLGVRTDTGLLCAADILRYLPRESMRAGC